MRRLPGCILMVALILMPTVARAQGASGPSGAPSSSSPPLSTPASTSDDGTIRTRTSETGVESRDAGLLGGSFPLPGAVDPMTYRVGPGDLLILQLWGRVSRSIPLEVGPEGTVLVPGAGPVMVDRRTLSEVRLDLIRRMSRQLRNVEVDLRLARPRTFRIYLTGQVRTPGPMVATGAYRVGDVLTGAMLLEGASRRRITVMHTDGAMDSCDLDLFLQTGDASLNPWLRDGDMIRVPTATEFVYAQGAVARPGRYELGVRDSARTLLKLAGDPLPSAVVDRVLIVRFRDAVTPESLLVSLDDIYDCRKDFALDDGERIYVYFLPQYHLQHEATILGEVQRPGMYPIVEGHARLSSLVSSAEGFQRWADLSAIRVHRRSSILPEKDAELDRLLRLSRNELTATEYEVMRTKLAGQREDYRVDWTRMLGNRDLDLLLRDGDIVRVDRLPSSIRVDGEVQRPGILNFVRGGHVEDYVVQAGGFTSRAWRGKVRVTRSVTGQTLLAKNVRTLDPGDFVWVPEKPDVTIWDQTKQILTALAQAATVIIAIRSVR